MSNLREKKPEKVSLIKLEICIFHTIKNKKKCVLRSFRVTTTINDCIIPLSKFIFQIGILISKQQILRSSELKLRSTRVYAAKATYTRCHQGWQGFFTSIFRVFAIEENQEALSTSGQESNTPQKDNNDEERPAGFNILPTDPAFRQPGAAGLSVLELDHESLTIVPNKLRTSQNSQCNESSCSEQWELIPNCGHSDSESSSGEEWELIPDDGRSNSESTSGEHWELIPDCGHSDSESTSSEQWELIPDDGRSNSESTSGEHCELIPDHGHSDSERSSGESWESLSDYHSASDDSVCDDSVCVENNCGDPWQKLQEPLQGTGTQPKQGAVSRFLLLVNENLILSTLLGVIWYLCSYLFLLIKGILSLVTGKGINPGSCVLCGAVARSLHHNVGQNTNCGGDQTIGGVNHEEGHSRLVVNGAGDIVISHLYINTSASHGLF
ncbi:uncharacterized protein LOC141649968 [Silene latifolia]|uniref:uncharacterized protein LOC141649968 n=1 Tax=Silene latifolia TaxID=37657 RepID=UPI003D775B39